jgi:hypothetical protein
MSRIDTPRSTAGAPLSQSGERVTLGERRSDGSIMEIAPSAPRPRSELGYGRQAPPQTERDTHFSVGAVRASDLAPLAGLESDRLASELARIDVRLDAMRERERDPGAKQSYEIGQTALSELQRRLQVLNAGYSALVMKW